MNGIVTLTFEEKLFKDGRIKVVVKDEVIKILKAVEKKVGNYEFSVLFKGRWSDEKGAYVVEPEFYIPKQKVRSAFVEITEDVAGKILEGYIVAFHKHPDGLRTFSSHDYENICAVFPISLLYVDKTIPVGTVKVPLPDANATVLVPADVEIEYDIPEIDIDGKIEKEDYSYRRKYLFGNYSSYGSVKLYKSGSYDSWGLDKYDTNDTDDYFDELAEELEDAKSKKDVINVLEELGVSDLDEALRYYGDDSEKLKEAILNALARFGNVRVE